MRHRPLLDTGASYQGTVSAVEFLHFVLTPKYQLTTALARLRERGDRAAVGEGAGLARGKSTPHPRLRRTLSPWRGPLSTAVPLVNPDVQVRLNL